MAQELQMRKIRAGAVKRGGERYVVTLHDGAVAAWGGERDVVFTYEQPGGESTVHPRLLLYRDPFMREMIGHADACRCDSRCF